MGRGANHGLDGRPVKTWIVVLAAFVVAIGFALIVRSVFPKTVASPPRIRTVYDTVRALDTVWIQRLRRDTIKINVTELVRVTVPETIYVAPRVRGITGFHAGKRIGDSTIVGGFTLEPLDSGYTRRDWLVQFYTMGPVRSLVTDSVPRITFYPYVPPCGRGCSIKKYLLGGSVGAGLGLLACTVTR